MWCFTKNRLKDLLQQKLQRDIKSEAEPARIRYSDLIGSLNFGT